MRNYLQNLNIVEAMLVFREGDLLRVSIQYYVDNVDKVIILLDNYDKKSEDIVKGFAKKYPNKVIYGYSTVPIEYSNKGAHKMYHRFKRFEGEIRQQLLDLVKTEHNKKSIDLLYWLDADEVPTNHFYKEVEVFWKSDKKALRVGYIYMFNGFNMISGDHIRAHYRVFKYIPEELQAYPFRGLAQLFPDLKKREIMCASGYGYFIVHMSDFSLKYIVARNNYQQRCKEGHKFREKKLWKVNKDVRDLMPEEYVTIRKTQKSIGTVAEYLEKFNIDKYGRKKQDDNIKLNLGCGAFPLSEPEFINLDKSRKYGRWYFQDGLKYFDNSINAITISHALMYLNEEELWKFLKEAHRVLKINGVIRITEDNTTDPKSSVYGGWHKERKPPPFRILTDAKMMREALGQAYFKVYDVKPDETHYKDKSLIQQNHGTKPYKNFWIEGIK